MNWDDLQYVLAVHRETTLLRAASVLGVAHTTVSRRLKALEEELGARLFDRTPEGLVPTGAGADLCDVAERVEAEVVAAENRMLGRDEQLQGELKVSTADIIFLAFEGIFTSFIERYPTVELTVTTTEKPVSLARREADVVIRLSSAPPADLFGRKVGYVQFAAYASRELAKQIGEGASLGAFPWIGWERRAESSWFESWLSANAPDARIALRLDYRAPMMLHAVRSGMGAQILPCVLGDADPALQRIAPLNELFRLDLWVLTLPDLRTNSRVRAFVSHAADALRERAGVLAGVGS